MFIGHILSSGYRDEIVVKVFMVSNFREPMLSERKEATAKNNSSIMRNAWKGAKRV